MKIVKGIGVGLIIFLTFSFIGGLLWEDAKTANAQSISSIQGIAVRSNGIVTVDRWICFSPFPMAPPIVGQPSINQQQCPTRIELSADIHKSLMICLSNPDGQTCKKIEDIFGAK